MIYSHALADAPIDQGDIIDGCPVFAVLQFEMTKLDQLAVKNTLRSVIVLTQTCEFANNKATVVNVAEVTDAQQMVADKILKPADIKGPLRSGRIWGLYFLPADAPLGL